ncbi:hypothetical protein EMM73_06305 [Rheinheimera sediminis]|uniref:hypothetical protein n=1 Tax=Rheinheimera sp. YQF-1 TaxID=2499626 RepID=UPI000FD7F074|nr:hypothetical protein [Rheinheimera sp. YQF-1]RVT47161.1 hypothetical protein EMM73_06305 [Rheinheimera sp. YQF-1]
MRLVILTFFLVLLAACSENSEPEAATVLKLYQDDFLTVNLSPADAPVEEILHWTVKLSDGWTIQQATVKGVSMSMGIVPLQFKPVVNQQRLYAAEMVLGACSQPKMQWQLQLKLHHATLGDKAFELPFYSSWPK